MKELSKERLLYWVKTKIGIVNVKEQIAPSEEEMQAYMQINQIIKLHFDDDWQTVKKELGKFMQKKKREVDENQIKEALDYLGNIVETYVDKQDLIGDEPFVYGRAKDAIELLRFNLKEGKCEHDWFDITVHDEKYGKTYKCSKCPEEKFEPDEKIKKIKSVAGDIFKTFSLGILYEKLIATPAIEIKKLVMEEVKKELEQTKK